MENEPETIAVELPFDLINRLVGLQAITGREPQAVIEAAVRRHVARQEIAVRRYVANFLQEPSNGEAT